MNFWIRMIELFDTTTDVPPAYGSYHLISIILTVVLAVALSLLYKKIGEKNVRWVILTVSVIAILLEVYKQITYTFSVENGEIVSDYQWYAFPFQFCSVPMYAGVLAGLTKGKLHDCLCAFLASYAIFAGLCVMIYPGDVFSTVAGVNFQTMYCHGSMITLGVFLLAVGYVKNAHKTILRAMPVFAVAVGLAVIMNEVVYRTNIAEGETFNMFFVSPHFEGTLPVYSTIQQIVPYPWCLILYILAFSIAAYVILLAATGIRALLCRLCGKKQSVEQKETVCV